MTTQTALRERYVSDAVSTVSPARLVLMLYDALSADLVAAEQAMAAGSLETVSAKLVRAQDILLELYSGLDQSAWSGGPGLAQLYTWLHAELVSANAAKDAAKVATCRRLVEPLRDAWHQAARELGAAS